MADKGNLIVFEFTGETRQARDGEHWYADDRVRKDSTACAHPILRRLSDAESAAKLNSYKMSLEEYWDFMAARLLLEEDSVSSHHTFYPLSPTVRGTVSYVGGSDVSNTMQQDLTNIANLLNNGGDAAVVAKKLKNAGCKGNRTEAASCPVANYMKMSLPAATNVTVNCSYIRANGEGITTPPGIAAFVRAFDGGSYSELVA